MLDWIHSTDPVFCGMWAWGMSGFLYISFLNGLAVFGSMIITGVIGWFIAYMTHKEFNERKKLSGFEGQQTHMYEDKSIIF